MPRQDRNTEEKRKSYFVVYREVDTNDVSIESFSNVEQAVSFIEEDIPDFEYSNDVIDLEPGCFSVIRGYYPSVKRTKITIGE